MRPAAPAQLGSISTKVGEGPGETHALLGSAPDTEVISGPFTPDYGAASPGEQELGSRLQAEDVGREALLFLLLFPQSLPCRVPRGWSETPAHGPGWREASQRGDIPRPEPWSGVLRGWGHWDQPPVSSPPRPEGFPGEGTRRGQMNWMLENWTDGGNKWVHGPAALRYYQC